MSGTLFMEFLDGTIIQTAAPAIAREFAVPALDVNIAMVSYLVAVAAGVPASRWLASRFGVRDLYLASVVLFLVASVACALSTDLTMLTIARAVQGLGGALMVPVGRLAVLRRVEPRDLLDAVAFLTWPALLAPVVAPVLGGLIADTIGWRWIFLINVPLGLVAVIVGLLLLRDYRDRETLPFDVIGFMLLAGALVFITVGAERLADSSAVEVVIGVVLVAVGGVALVVGALQAARRVDPIIDWRVMAIATFRVGNVSGAVYRAVVTAAPLMITLLFQVGFGWSATTAGVLVVALFLGNVAVKPATSPIIRALGFRRTIVFSSALGALCFGLIGFVDDSTPVAVTAVLLVVSGALRSIGFTAYGSVQFADVPSSERSNANTLSSTIQQLATALGVAIAAVLIHLGGLVSALAPGDPAVGGYRWAFVLGAALMMIPIIGAARLASDAGAHATTS